MFPIFSYKYRKSTRSAPLKTLFKRKWKAAGGQEWLCQTCNLTFDNVNIFNLHTISHAGETGADDGGNGVSGTKGCVTIINKEKKEKKTKKMMMMMANLMALPVQHKL